MQRGGATLGGSRDKDIIVASPERGRVQSSGCFGTRLRYLVFV